MDYCSLQELKTTQAFDRVISNDGVFFRLISFVQDSGKRGGLGFVMSPRVEIFLVQHKWLSDRVDFADFKSPHLHNGKNKKNTRCVLCRSLQTYQSTGARGARRRGEHWFCVWATSTAEASGTTTVMPQYTGPPLGFCSISLLPTLLYVEFMLGQKV